VRGVEEARVWLIRTHFFNLTSAAARATRADKGTTVEATGATTRGNNRGSYRLGFSSI